MPLSAVKDHPWVKEMVELASKEVARKAELAKEKRAAEQQQQQQQKLQQQQQGGDTSVKNQQ